MTGWTLMGLVFIVGAFEDSSALKCMECIDIPHPSFCDKVVTCPQNSSCQLTQYVTTSLSVLYSSGCQSNEVCKRLSKRADDIPSAIEDASLDSNVCEECCHDQDFCNMKGCGQSVTPFSQRGPYCYKCSVANAKYGCRTLTQCAQHEACALETGSFPGTYKSGCTSQTNCPPSIFSTHHRRWLMVNQPSCCTSDFCNDITQVVDQNPQPGTVNGVWSPWIQWSLCSHTCGTGGTRLRNRSCDNPPPQHNGLSCLGKDNEISACGSLPCPVNGSWSSWSHWSSCSRTCGDAIRSRSRKCDNPAPQHNGAQCHGITHSIQSCHLPKCSDGGPWSEWSPWGACVGPCDDTRQYRFRVCHSQHGCHDGDKHEMRSCENRNNCSVSMCNSALGFRVVTVGTQRFCLYLSEGAHSWSQSRQRCIHRGGDLVSIGNIDVDYAVRTFLLGRLKPCGDRCDHDETHSYAWYGLNTIDKHNGHSFSWTNPNVPFKYNDLQGHDHPHSNRCIVGGGELYERWYNVRCNLAYMYLCEMRIH